jgi:hypothetical protein
VLKEVVILQGFKCRPLTVPRGGNVVKRKKAAVVLVRVVNLG